MNYERVVVYGDEVTVKHVQIVMDSNGHVETYFLVKYDDGRFITVMARYCNAPTYEHKRTERSE